MSEIYERPIWETDPEQLLDWEATLNSHSSGSFDLASFKETFKNAWQYLMDQSDWGADGEICIDTCHIPLILRIYDLSKRREVPEGVPRRVFEAVTTFCESLVDSLSKNDLGLNIDSDGCVICRKAIVTGYIELGVSWDLSKVIHIEQFEEEFAWLCQYYGETYGY